VPSHKKGGVGNWLRKKFKRQSTTNAQSSTKGQPTMKNKTSSLAGTTEELLLEAIDIKESHGDYIDPDFDLEASGDLKYCPACIELNDHKRDNRRRRFYYMLTIHDLLKANNEAMLSVNHDQLPIRLKTYSEIQKHSGNAIPLVNIPKMHKNKKFSALEKRRRQIVESYRVALKNASPSGHHGHNAKESAEALKQLKTFLLPITEVDNSFLGGNITLYEKYGSSTTSGQGGGGSGDRIKSWEGHVALALSRRHFTEQYMVVNREAIYLRKNMDSKKNNLVIKCDSIVSVQSLPVEYCPIPEFSILQIETYPRIYYFLLRSNLQVNQWLEVFITILGHKCMNSPYRMIDFADKSHITHQSTANNNNNINNSSCFSPTSPGGNNNNNTTVALAALLSTNNPVINIMNNTANTISIPANNNITMLEPMETVYYERPADLKGDKRRIYNYRRIFFTTTIGDRYQHIHPNDLIVSILKTAFFLTSEAEHNTATEYDWVKFWDEISLLQCVDLRKLNEIEKTAFFLNVYHVMVLHGALIFGPPNTGIWNAFFSNICKRKSFFHHFYFLFDCLILFLHLLHLLLSRLFD
jgi:hypothetical protein